MSRASAVPSPTEISSRVSDSLHRRSLHQGQDTCNYPVRARDSQTDRRHVRGRKKKYSTFKPLQPLQPIYNTLQGLQRSRQVNRYSTFEPSQPSQPIYPLRGLRRSHPINIYSTFAPPQLTQPTQPIYPLRGLRGSQFV